LEIDGLLKSKGNHLQVGQEGKVITLRDI